MGTSTPHLNLYKPDGSELVDVSEQLNQNFDKIDTEALSHETRLDAVEGVAGLTPSQTFVPTFRDTGLVALTGGTERAGRVFKFGKLVFVQATVVGPLLPDSVRAEPRLYLDLPYAPIDPYLLDFQGSVDFAGSNMLLRGRHSSTANRVLMSPFKEIGDGNFITIDDTTDINWGSVTGKVIITGWYFSTGATTGIDLTDE